MNLAAPGDIASGADSSAYSDCARLGSAVNRPVPLINPPGHAERVIRKMDDQPPAERHERAPLCSIVRTDTLLPGTPS
jgi:hypothetical protein